MSEQLRFFPYDPKEIHDDLIAAVSNELGEALYPGDERVLFTEAFSAVLIQSFASADDGARQYMLRYARGNVLDALGERVDVKREEGKPAKTSLRFAVQNSLEQNVLIPLGTRVTPDGTLYFKTTEIGVIEAGSLTIEVLAESTGVGTAYNGFPIGSISSLVDSIPMVGSVVNTEVSGGGDDGEPYTEEGDNHFRERIRQAPVKLSTAGPYNAYKYHAKTAHTGIVDVAVWSPSPGCVSITPLLENGEIPSSEILELVKEACNATHVRPLTDYVEVLEPKLVLYDIELVYYMRAEEETEVVLNVEGENGAIVQYIKWQSEAIGRDINPDQLRKTILAPDWEENLLGALRLDVISPSYQMLIGEVEADEQSTLNVEIARWSGKLTVSHKVVEE